MPQPALHLLLAETALDHWRRGSGPPPFDVASAAAVNAFRHGSLGPDLGNFPGGDRELGRRVHTQRTRAQVCTLLDGARGEAQRAYAWGWLAHVLADAAIHPLVNAAAAAHAHGDFSLLEHVRVEVGLDAWFSWQNPALRGLRLRPVPNDVYRLVADMLHITLAYPVTPAGLRRMEAGCTHFTHAAVHFATAVAVDVCWGDAPAHETAPPSSQLLWNLASALSPRSSIAFAYLNPHRPDAALVARVEAAIQQFFIELERCVAQGPWHLPEYNLEDGSIVRAGSRVA